MKKEKFLLICTKDDEKIEVEGETIYENIMQMVADFTDKGYQVHIYQDRTEYNVINERR